MRVVVLITIIGLVFANLSIMGEKSSGQNWENDHTWAYKWIGNWNRSQYQWGDAISDINIYGKYAKAYLIRYAGEDDIGYVFKYEGGYYSYGYVRAIIKGKWNNDSFVDMINIKVDKIWIDFSGEFHLVKIVTNSDLGGSYYGIRDLTVHIYTKEPLWIYINFTSKHTLYPSHEEAMMLKGTFNISGKATFSKPIPYIPSSSNYADAYGITENYSGHIKVDTNGYLKFLTYQPYAKGVDITYSLDKNIDSYFKNTVALGWFSLMKNNNTVYYPMIIEELPEKTISMCANGDLYEGDIQNLLVPSGQTLVEGNYNISDMFYDTVNTPAFGYNEPLNLLPYKTYGKSEIATSIDVKNVENDAPRIYGSLEEKANNVIFVILPFIIATVAIIIMLIIVVIKRRKRNKKKKHY